MKEIVEQKFRADSSAESLIVFSKDNRSVVKQHFSKFYNLFKVK